MNITIKNIKHNEHLSEETHCFSATVYIDGKRSFGVKNAGHGGSDDYFALDDKTSNKEVREMLLSVNKELEKTKLTGEYSDLTNDLEIVVGDLVNDYLTDKHILKMLKRICYLKDKIVYVSNNLPTDLFIERLKTAHWWKPEYKVLNNLPIEDIRKYFK